MFEWLGSLRVDEHSPGRAVLRIRRSTRWAGIAICALGVLLTAWVWSVWPALALIPGSLAVVGLVVATLQRELVVDRQAGVLRVQQRFLGLGTNAVVPLFHLRAVVVTARPETEEPGGRRRKARFVAYVERRVGDAIYLDEARRCAPLMSLAEAVADVAELRLEYEAPQDGAAWQ